MDDRTKKTRASVACDMCRRRKVRCDTKSPSCTNCLNGSTRCVYTRIPRKSRPTTVKRAAVLQRLDQIEKILYALMKSQGVSHADIHHSNKAEDEDNSESDLLNHDQNGDSADDSLNGDARPTSGVHSSSSSEASGSTIPASGKPDPTLALPRTDRTTAIFDMAMSSFTESNLDALYNSGVLTSMFTPKSIRWIESKTRNPEIVQTLKRQFIDLMALRDREMKRSTFLIMHPQPIDETFAHRALSLYSSLNEPFFYLILSPVEVHELLASTVERRTFGQTITIYSLIYRMAAWLSEHNNETSYSRSFVEHQAENALCHANHSLIFMSITYPSFALLKSLVVFVWANLRASALIRVCQFLPTIMQICCSLGLNRKETYLEMTPEEAKKRKIIWWALCTADRFVTSMFTRSPTVSCRDVSTPIELQGGPEYLMLNGAAALGNIYAEIYDKVFCIAAQSNDENQILADVLRIDNVLLDWRQRYSGVIETYRLNVSSSNRQGHALYLELKYLYFRLLLHRSLAFSHAASPVNRESLYGCETPFTHRQSFVICVETAREILQKLSQLRDVNRFFDIGLIIMATSSFVTLFTKCLMYPGKISTNADIQLLLYTVGEVSHFEKNNAWRPLLGLWSNLIETAKGTCQTFAERAAQQPQATSISSSQTLPLGTSAPEGPPLVTTAYQEPDLSTWDQLIPDLTALDRLVPDLTEFANIASDSFSYTPSIHDILDQ